MRGSPISRFRLPVSRKWRRGGSLLGPITCSLAVALAAATVSFIERHFPGSNLIWVANGLFLSHLLLAPRWRWPVYLAAGFGGLVLGSLFLYGTWEENLASNLLNVIEILIGVLPLRHRSRQLPQFTNRAYTLRFLGFAALAGPLTTGAIFALTPAILLHGKPFQALLTWTVSDGLGTAVIAPAYAAILRTHLRAAPGWGRHLVLPVIVAILTAASFAIPGIPAVFFIQPILLLILLRQGLGWASFSTMVVAVVGGWFTLLGAGPFAYVGLHSSAPSVLMQIFVGAAMFMLYSVSVVLGRHKETEKRLQEIAALHKLVTENSRDVIILADFDGRRNYVSNATNSMAGWTPEELVKQESLALVHPEDRPQAIEVVKQLYAGAEGSRIEVRVRKADGEYIWVEASLRVVRDSRTGRPSGLLNIVRDVTDRKLAEQQLKDAYHAVEALAITDALTGLANRRRFDHCLISEWRRGMRDRTPLSMVLLDADLFKSYNDTYGHLRGDSCLKQIAEAAMDVVARPGDVVARFGGEEFAILLPNTANDGAMAIANEICTCLFERRLPHVASPFKFVTISVGCATMVPSLGRHSVDLIELADAALYGAKNAGRNRVCNGNTMPPGIETALASELLDAVKRPA